MQQIPQMRAGGFRRPGASVDATQSPLTEANPRGTHQGIPTARHTSMTGNSVFQLTRHQKKLMAASDAIQSEAPERIDYLHTVQCQCGIPYRNPGDAVRE